MLSLSVGSYLHHCAYYSPTQLTTHHVSSEHCNSCACYLFTCFHHLTTQLLVCAVHPTYYSPGIFWVLLTKLYSCACYSFHWKTQLLTPVSAAHPTCYSPTLFWALFMKLHSCACLLLTRSLLSTAHATILLCLFSFSCFHHLISNDSIIYTHVGSSPNPATTLLSFDTPPLTCYSTMNCYSPVVVKQAY